MLPASFILTDGFDNIETRPFASGGFADLYKATHRGKPVVVKALKNACTGDPDSENVRKVSNLICGQILHSDHTKSLALR